MARITIMRGLPGSGKSTHAQELAEKSGNMIRVDKDLLREMLHFGKWSGVNEGITREVEKLIAMYILTSTNKTLVVDDTNLKPEDLAYWKNIAGMAGGVTTKLVEMRTPIEECIANDAARPKPVGRATIIKLALKAGVEVEKILPTKQTVIVDVDGTLANVKHRLKYVKKTPKDWKSFFDAAVNDPPNQEIVDMVNALAKKYNIVIVSGRPERYREMTTEWLEGNGVRYDVLLMRPDNNSRDDDEVKAKLFDDYLSKLNIKLVIDDRPSVIRMWKEKGLEVLDVGPGPEHDF